MHPRVCVNLMVFGDTPLAEAVDHCRGIGVARLGVPNWMLEAAGWEAGAAVLAGCGMTVATIVHPSMFHLDAPDGWAEERAALVRTLDTAAALGAETVYTTTGPAGILTWEEAADALREASGPVVDHARSLGIPLTIETTNPLRVGASFVHSLADAVLLSEQTGLGVCVDIYACWTERDLAGTIRRAIDRIALVQVSDFVVGTLDMPNRAVPGDGDIPLRRIVGWLLEAGYEGPFDLELLGPRIEAEGPLAAARRSAERLSELLESLGA